MAYEMAGSDQTRILIVEDDPEIAGMLVELVKGNGFEASSAKTGIEMDRLLARDNFDLIVLDAMLPGEDGFSICRRLRSSRSIPILMLTALQEDIDRILGLELGADDYVTKPFNVVEVVARVEALLRRARQGGPPDDGTLRCADLALNEAVHRVTRAGVPVMLSPTEFRLLQYLLLNAGRVVSKGQILQQVWQYDFGGDAGVVERFVSNLRRKIDDGREPLIHTVRGFGYTVRSGAP
jgi:two-component system OmpR family response regulator